MVPRVSSSQSGPRIPPPPIKPPDLYVLIDMRDEFVVETAMSEHELLDAAEDWVKINPGDTHDLMIFKRVAILEI